MVDVLEIPEHALAAFEMLTGLTVTVHDLTNTLHPYIDPVRFQHHSHWCSAVKRVPHGELLCFELEVTQLRPQLADFRQGRFHVCHAGFVEWVVPVWIDDAVAWVLFAGLRRPAANFRPMATQQASDFHTWPWDDLPPTVTTEQAEIVLEGLRQLAARLHEWWQQAQQVTVIHAQGERASGVRDRQRIIYRFIAEHHTRPITLTDMANLLGLSASRTAHMIHEVCGAPFTTLLLQARLRTAAALLRNTSLPISSVAASSGFNDLAYFHRIFKRALAMTPYRYRHHREG